MNLLQKAMLRRQANIFKLKYAFANVKLQTRINELQQKQFSFRGHSDTKEQKPQDIELENKELYLKYMQQVLDRKQKQLMEFEEYLLKHKKQQDQQEIKRTIHNPLHLTQLAQTLNKKVEVFKDIIEKYSLNSKNQVQLEKLAQSLNVVEETCKENYNQLKETLLQNHQELILQKEQLSVKLSKLHELESYQKYLNQLQNVLEQKQYQIIRKQSEMKPLETPQHLSVIPANSPTYNTFQEQEEQSSHSEVSVRKRAKIFEHRNSSKPNEISVHNKSSKIMQERSCEQAMNCQLQASTDNSTSVKSQSAMLVSQATQSTIEDPLIANIVRINNQAQLVKFLKLWTKFSGNHTKGSNQYRSLMYLYQWRLNTLFDQSIKDSVVQMVRWPRCLQPFADLPPLNYAELSLKKKKYLQNFFDFQRRLLQRKKIKTQLQSIIKNKNRRERTAFFLYFKKFRQVIKILTLVQSASNGQGQPLKEITLQQSQSNNTAISKVFKQSRIISNSGVLLTEDKSKQTISKTRSNKTNIQSSQPKLKGRQASVDIAKFRDYIKSQEENEAKLAIECIRMQAVFRMSSVLSIATNRLFNKLFSGLSRQSDTNRIDSLQKAINGYDFKWELFMAKIRVALTSNTNKIGHLEQLVSFIGNDK